MQKNLKIMVFSSLLFSLGLGLSACGPKASAARSGSSPVLGVDLGTQGNIAVAQRYRAYVAKGHGCFSTGKNPRVLLTGFGLFSGVNFNISGLVVDNMRSEKFWPHEMSVGTLAPRGLQTVSKGILSALDEGGSVTNRTLMIDGRAFDFCFLLVDVQWDLAAAIIVHEMENFQPNLVVMTGRGSWDRAVLEGGASNQSTPLQGYQPNGNLDGNNTPVALNNPVLPPQDPGVQPEIAMTWNNQILQKATENFIAQLGFSVDAPSRARADNNYVCNNIAFVAAHAAKGVKLNLAGGKLVLDPVITSHPQIGFLHIPANGSNSAASVLGWSKVLATIVINSL